MYERFFGFSTAPFSLTPDPRFLYRSRHHSMALTLLEYGLESRAMFGLLTGAIGTGKTTLLRQLLSTLDTRLSVGLISNTHSGFTSIHPWVVSAFSLVPANDSDISMYEALAEYFRSENAAGRRCLLIVDEAQNLTPTLLEQLRLLSNVNQAQDLMLQVFLVGQPELRETLRRPDLAQFAQRISADYHLRAFAAEDTADYVRHRVKVAGGAPELFDSAALLRIHDQCRGVPRLINQLCDVALVYAYAVKQSRVDRPLIDEVILDRRNAGALGLFGQGADDERA